MSQRAAGVPYCGHATVLDCSLMASQRNTPPSPAAATTFWQTWLCLMCTSPLPVTLTTR